MESVLKHHGILGQKWGIRRFQNPDGTLTDAGRRRLERKDAKWARRNYNKITKPVQRSVARDIRDYARTELDPKFRGQKYTTRGKLNAYYVNEYNRKLAALMNQNVGEITAPSGRIVQFVAKRGEMGVHMALADRGYDMSQVKNGVFNSGKIAYRKQNVQVG